MRVIHHLMWRKAAAEWIAWQAYPTPMSAMPPRFLAQLSVEQRGLFGFPAVRTSVVCLSFSLFESKSSIALTHWLTGWRWCCAAWKRLLG